MKVRSRKNINRRVKIEGSQLSLKKILLLLFSKSSVKYYEKEGVVLK